MMGTGSANLESDQINELLAKFDTKQRLSQFIRTTKEKYEKSDGILAEVKKIIENFAVDDPTKKTPKQKSKFSSQNKDRLEKFQDQLSAEYKELIERLDDLSGVICSFDWFNDNVVSNVTSFLQSRSSPQSKTLDSLFEELNFILDGFKNRKNTISGKNSPTVGVTIDPIVMENHPPQIPLQNASNLNGGNIRDIEPLPGPSGVCFKRKNDDRVGTEQNRPSKVSKTRGKKSIRDDRHVDEDFIGSAMAESSSRLNGADEHDHIPDEHDVIIISDDSDDCDETEDNDSINGGYRIPSYQVTPFKDVPYARVEGCRDIAKEDHDALHDPTWQYTGNIMNRFMFLALRQLNYLENLRKHHCDVLITDKAFDVRYAKVEPLKEHERCFVQVLHQQKLDHWVLCYGERNHAGFEIRIYDSLKRDYQLTKKNREFLERLCGSRELSITKQKFIDIQPKNSNDSGAYVLAFASARLTGKNPGLCSIPSNRFAVRDLIKKTMIEMASVPTLMVYVPPLYPLDEPGIRKYERFVSSLCNLIGKTSKIRNRHVLVTISEATFSNDRVTKKYLYPLDNSPYASILYHHPTGTYFLISNIEPGVNSKQAHIYEVDPDRIAPGLMKMMKPSSSDSSPPKCVPLIPLQPTKSTPRQIRLDERKLRNVDRHSESRLSGIDENCIEAHPQKWDDGQTAIHKKVNSLILCVVKVLELTNYIQPEEFDVTLLERKFENCIENLFTKFSRNKRDLLFEVLSKNRMGAL